MTLPNLPGFTHHQIGPLHFVGFPDGEDGLVFDEREFAAMDHVAVAKLGADRASALNAIRGALLKAGWGVRSEESGRWVLRGERPVRVFDVSFPLTFWLQREPWIAALRRFAPSCFEALTDSEIQSLAAESWIAESTALFDHHDRALDDFEFAIDLDIAIEAPEPWRPLNLEAWEQGSPEHRAWLAGFVPDVAVGTTLHRQIDLARSRLRAGDPLRFALDSSWVNDADEWLMPEERMALGAEVADSEVHAELDRNLAGRLVDAGHRHVLYASAARVRELCAADPDAIDLNWLNDLERIVHHVRWWNFAAIVPEAQRERLLEASERSLDNYGYFALAMRVLCRTNLALALRAPAVALALLRNKQAFDAFLCEMGQSYSVLKEAILALSLIAPGRECQALISKAAEHMDWATEPDEPATTALALAIAWERCARRLAS